MNRWIQPLRELLAGLAPRERMLVSVVGLLFVAALLYVGVTLPAMSASANIEERVTAAELQFEAMKRLRREYDDVHHRLSAIEERIRRGPKGNLRTTLETLADRASVKIESMEPQASPASDLYRETKVDVGLAQVTLPQAVKYLHGIESTEQLLSIKALRIRTRKDKPELLDVSFTVSSFEPL